jgi:hypothetical protein
MSTHTIERRSDASEARRTHVRRLASCLLLGFVLALMIGDQEGTQTDFGYAFRQAVSFPRIVVFLLVGVAVYLAVTFWPYLQPYLRRPGMRPMAAGAISVVVANALLKWSDNGELNTGRLSDLAKGAADTGALDSLARAFFGSVVPALYWVLFLVVLVLGIATVVRNSAVLAWVTATLAVLTGVWGLYAQSAVHSFLGGVDHTTGALVGLLGYLAIAAGAITVARSAREEADTRSFIDRVFSWRIGMPLVVLGGAFGLISLFIAAWFSPQNNNDHFLGLSARFSGSGVSVLTSAYVNWLGWLLFAGVLALAAVTS